MSVPFNFGIKQIERMFPFYIHIDRNLKILNWGNSLDKVNSLKKGELFNELFSIPRPQTSISSFQDLIDLQNQLIVLKPFSDKDFILRGQFEFLDGREEILFLGSPWFNSVEQISQNKLVIKDFANHDPLIDLLHVLKSIELTNEDLKELIETSNRQKDALKKINKEFRDSALFTEQNPDPLLRIDFSGELLQNNPAASKLDFIEYQGKVYRYDEFFKLIVTDRPKEFNRWEIECSSNKVDYVFTCVSIPKEGYVNFYGIDITEQKRNRSELGKLSKIVEETINAVIIADISGRIEWVNKGFEKMTGYTLQEAKGKSPGSLLQGEETDPETVDYMRRKILNAEPFTCEILNYKKNGEPYWLRINAQPIYDESGEPIEFFAIEEDITLEKQIQKKLESQRRFYEQILDNIPADIAVFDKDHTYIYVNPKGIRDDKLRKWLIGKKDEDYIAKRNKPESLLLDRRLTFNSVLKSKQLQSWEEKLEQPDGNSKFIMRNLYPVLKNQDEVEMVIGYGVDITNVKKIQEQIQQSEKKYRDVIDNSLAIITIHDLDGRFLTVNPMVEKLFGFKEKEVVGRFLTDFMPEEDKRFFNEDYLNSIRKEKEAKGTFRVIHKNGDIVYCLYNNFLKEEPGKEPYIIGFSVDITVRVQAEKELKRAKKVTEELAISKQNFLANMSHEIRTPMNAIMGMSNQLLKTDLDTKQQGYLETITNSSENLLVIINDILDLSKLEAGKLIIESIGFELKNLIDRLVQGMRYKAEEKGLLLSNSEFDPRINKVLIGDPFRINQILLNLVSNAIKFTKHGGVDLKCRFVEGDKNHQNIEIVVVDTGIGMNPSFAANLFDKFSQEDESITRRFGGTGLGMSISKSLVDLMGGEILVESEKGIGTEVKLRFEFLNGSEEDLKVNDDEFFDTEELKGKKVLVVDDNEINRLIASTILVGFGLQVSEVENGVEAVEIVRENSFDLILMDIQMPRLNGYEATKIIREELKSQIPIVALTANAIKGEAEKCIKAGMNGYLSKPFKEEQLLQVVFNWIEKSENSHMASDKSKDKVTLYDLGKLNEIAKGNQEFVNKMKNIFIDQATSSMQEMKEAFQKREYSKVKGIAHKIKPSIGTMGITSLYNEIREIENNIEAEESSVKMEKLISKLDKILKEVIIELKQSI